MEFKQFQKEQLNKIGRKFNLNMALLFGSQVTGKGINQESDFDIAILDSKEESYKRFRKLFSAFSKIFKGYNVDLRFIKGSEPVFLYQVFKNSQLLYGNSQDYYNYKAFAYKNYIDSQSLFNLKTKILAKKQKELKKQIND